VQWDRLENLVILDPKVMKVNLVNQENLDPLVQRELKDHQENKVKKDLLVMTGLRVYLAIRVTLDHPAKLVKKVIQVSKDLLEIEVHLEYVVNRV